MGVCLFCTLESVTPLLLYTNFLHRELFVDCTHKKLSVFSFFLHISHSFPMAVIFHREQHKCDNIFLRPFSFF